MSPLALAAVVLGGLGLAAAGAMRRFVCLLRLVEEADQ